MNQCGLPYLEKGQMMLARWMVCMLVLSMYGMGAAHALQVTDERGFRFISPSRHSASSACCRP